MIKSADDKRARILLLQELAERPGLEARTREWARDELLRLQRGLQGERDAAHFLDSCLRTDRDRRLIHDLRLVVRNGLNMRSAETTREFAEMLCRQHRPADALQLPGFVQDRVDALSRAPAPSPVRTSATAATPAPALAPVGACTVAEGDAGAPPRKLVCAHCGEKISFAEGRFCWNQAGRFGGLQYCRAHQAGR